MPIAYGGRQGLLAWYSRIFTIFLAFLTHSVPLPCPPSCSNHKRIFLKCAIYFQTSVLLRILLLSKATFLPFSYWMNHSSSFAKVNVNLFSKALSDSPSSFTVLTPFLCCAVHSSVATVSYSLHIYHFVYCVWIVAPQIKIIFYLSLNPWFL